MTTLARVDLLGPIRVMDAEADLPPGEVAAVRTPEGYLRATGYLARAGTLRYSDGASSWIEYRPREELVAAVESFKSTTITDGHPAAMLDATTWRQLARGVVLDSLEIVDLDGVPYLRGTLEIRDAALVAKADSGEASELSIGFWSDVEPTTNGRADDGTRADAVQTAIRGNHVAVVRRGRAGPECRVVLDGADIPTAHPFGPSLAAGLVTMPTDKNDKTKKKTDAAAGPTETAMVKLASGAEVEVPTELVAELEALRAQVAQLQAPQPAAPPPMTAAPAPPPAPPMDAGMMPKPMPDPNPDDEKTLDSDDAPVTRRRARLERAAGTLRIPDAKIDAADDDALAALVDDSRRAIVEERMPWASDAAKTARGDSLAALADAALAAPKKDAAETKTADAITPTPKKIERGDAEDDYYARIAKAPGLHLAPAAE